MYKKLLFAFAVFLFLFLSFPTSTQAAPPDEVDPHEVFIRGKVLEVVSKKLVKISDASFYEEKLKVQLLEGQEKGKTIDVETSGDPKQTVNQLQAGDYLVIDSKPGSYTVYEPYRLNIFWVIMAGFLLLVILIGGKKGLGAIVGLTISLLTITAWIIPNIIRGQDPLTTCITGSIVILIVTTYIAHGFSLKTTVAVIGTGIALLFTGWISILLVQVLRASGLGNEDIYTLQVGATNPINAQGLLLGGIIIGTLGALNDITTTQAMTIFTLVKENHKQKFATLFRKGMVIGKEHIASLVNTLILAYAGSSLAVFIFFALNPAQLPWWVILNNETTIEELIKAIVGSSALVLAVPITTALATFVSLRGLTFLEFLYPVFRELGLVKED